jgi:hypothetical protein
MKKSYALLSLCMLFCGGLMAQTEGLTYQAVLVDNNPEEIPGIDVPSSNIPNKEITIQFSILDALGNLEYQESQATQTDDYGTINLTIGLGEPTGQGTGSFQQINWDGPKTLLVDIDLEAGTNYIAFSAQPLTYLPYVRHRNLVADGTTQLNDDLFVNNGARSQFNGQVTVDARMPDTDQGNMASYPMLVKGSDHGMAIQLNGATPTRLHNFMSFWNGLGQPIGRIEGFRAFSDVNQGFILEVLLANEPTEDEAQEQDDDDAAPPAPAPAAFDIYLNNDYSLNLLLEYIDLLEASVSFGANLGACIAGIGIAGDCDDAAWSAFGLFVQGVQISLIISYNEANMGVAFESGGADYAEWLKKYDVQETLAFGDVVGVRAGEISKKFTTADNFMVISQNPIVTGAMPPPGEEHAYKRVAFIGQTPVKVLGTVNKGDYILPSGNGDGLAIAVAPEAMRINDYQRIVGVAWEAYQGNDLFSYIHTAVGINQNDMAREITEMQSVMNAMQTALAEANPNYKPTFFDVETVSVSNNVKTTASKNLVQLAMEQYGLDATRDREQVLADISGLMAMEDAQNDYFQFSKMPYLQEMLADPSPEAIEKYTEFYTKALERLKSMVRP